MKIESQIKRSEELVQMIDGKLKDLKIPSDFRTRIAVGCLDIALEHQKAIIIMVYKELYSSAFALIRANFESFVRGLWLHHCANDDDLERFKNGRVDRSFKEIIGDIEKIDGFGNGVLSRAHKDSWSILNDFTHSGIKQVGMRNKKDSIGPNYQEKDLVKILEFVNTTSIFSAIAIAEISNNDQLADDIHNLTNIFLDKENRVNMGKI